MRTPFKITSHSLFVELVLLTVSILLITIISIGWYTNAIFTQNTQSQHLRTLETIAEKKSGEISLYVDKHLDRIRDMATLNATIRASRQFEEAFKQGVESRAYAATMSEYNNALHTHLNRWGYYDLFLINMDGDIIYSAKHESDFGTNLNSGRYKNSQLAKAYREATTLLQATNSTFEYYAPSNEPAAFIAAPVVSDRNILGVLAVQLDTDEFYRVINDLSGLGVTGETVVGERKANGDVQVTAPLRHDPDAAFKRTMRTDASNALPLLEAANGINGTGFHTDWRGKRVIAAWQYIPSFQWGMVVKIDEDEAFASLHATQKNILIFTIIGLLIAYLAAVIVAHHITRPLVDLGNAFSSFSSGERSIRIDTSAITKKEIYQLAEGFNRMAAHIEQSEKSLRADRERLAVAVDQSLDAIILTDPDATIQYVNHAFELISGYSAEEAIGRNANIVKSGEMSNKFYSSMWGQIKSGDVWRSECTNRNKNGTLYVVDQTISPIMDEHNQIIGFTALQRDITEKKQEMKRLEHTQRLESLGVLAGGIAHDFNNLLTAILGNASLAKSQIAAHAPASKMLDSIEEASERAADLCKQMLAYSGKGKFVVRPINLSLMIEDMLNLLNISIGKSTSVKLNLDMHIPSIQADATQIQQIIMNLVINASEAIGEQPGIITIRTGHMYADEKYLDSLMLEESVREGEYVFLEVSDNGCGMDEAVRNKIFDPFFTTKFTGRGLGMSAILGIVRGHQGSIKIYSEPGQGSAFKLLFPASDAHTDDSTTKRTQDSEWRGTGTVLVVDDEKTLRQTAKGMLEDLGFEVLLANDGIEGVDKFRQHHKEISVVLLDMTMPRMSGENAFREMRLIDANVKVVLSSGYNEQDATSHFTGKGLAGFIQKPYSYDLLRSKLIQILDQGKTK